MDLVAHPRRHLAHPLGAGSSGSSSAACAPRWQYWFESASHLAEAVSRRLGCARAGLAHTTWSRRVPCVATVRRRKPAAPSNEFSRPSRFLPSERRRSRRWSTPGSVRNSEGVHEGDEVALPLRGGTDGAPRVVASELSVGPDRDVAGSPEVQDDVLPVVGRREVVWRDRTGGPERAWASAGHPRSSRSANRPRRKTEHIVTPASR